MSENQAQVLIISGFSGAGKGTMVKRLLKTYPDKFALSVSNTTRGPRPGEVDGVDYHFITQEAFDKLIGENGFLEYARYVNKSYGTPRAFVEENLAAGRHVILEIELQGARQVKKLFPDAEMIFITAPSAQDIFTRLVGRGTETKEVIKDRMRRAIDEADGVYEYSHILVNDIEEEAFARLYDMICDPKAHMAGEADYNKIKEIQKQLKDMLL